jgi:hypothetical protein
VKPEPAFHNRHGGQELLRGIITDGGRVGLLFTYDPALAETCGAIFKPLHGFYARELKAWIAPLTGRSAVLRALADLDPNCFPSDALSQRIEKAKKLSYAQYDQAVGNYPLSRQNRDVRAELALRPGARPRDACTRRQMVPRTPLLGF